MARPLQIGFADALYHVMPRGDDWWAVVLDHADRRRRCVCLTRRRFRYKVGEIAEALGYTRHGGSVTAIRRMETAS